MDKSNNNFLRSSAGGDVLERGGPVWSGVYGTGSSLQHAAQLQLLSQQQMLRQQELLMIQQHTVQVLELQRNAQLVVSGVGLVHRTAPTGSTLFNTDKHKAQRSCCMKHLCVLVRINKKNTQILVL